MDNICLAYCADDTYEHSTETSPISVSVNLEKETCSHDTAHNILASVKLNAHELPFGFAVRQRINADFVVVIDTNNTMKNQEKLASVLATIDYMMDILNEKDRFSLIEFNESAKVLFPLDYLTLENKSKILKILPTIQVKGNSNLGDGLFTAISILNSRQGEIPISRILLLTDGLSTRGMSHNEILEKLKQEKLQENLTIHCFGYGADHSSSYLQTIAFCSPGGMYYFIENSTQIAEMFSDCFAGTFSVVASSIRVKFEAFDGCRFIKIRTKFPFQSLKQMKNYIGFLGCMYAQESRSLLLRLSLRQMQRGVQNICKITVTYQSAVDQKFYRTEQIVSVNRMPESKNIPINEELGRQINRVTSAEAIDAAISAASVKNFGTAGQIINCAIQKISQSSTASDSYCRGLVADLQACKKCVTSFKEFATFGVHEAHQYSTMHNQERYVALRNDRSSAMTYAYCTQQAEKPILGNTLSDYLKAS